MYSPTQGWSLGTNIIVIIKENIHFRDEIKLNENPLIKHWIMLYIIIIATAKSNNVIVFINSKILFITKRF